jgi:hypothetical protein
MLTKIMNKRKHPLIKTKDPGQHFKHEPDRAVRLSALTPSPRLRWRGFLLNKGINVLPRILTHKRKYPPPGMVDHKNSPPRQHFKRKHYRAYACLALTPPRSIVGGFFVGNGSNYKQTCNE